MQGTAPARPAPDRSLTPCVLGSGKGTPRRKVKRAPARSGADDKKLQQTLKKLNTQPIQAIEEVNMFKSDGNVIHFAAPKGESSAAMVPVRGACVLVR